MPNVYYTGGYSDWNQSSYTLVSFNASSTTAATTNNLYINTAGTYTVETNLSNFAVAATEFSVSLNMTAEAVETWNKELKKWNVQQRKQQKLLEQQRKEEAARKAVAKEKAKELLVMHLDALQLAQFSKKGWFFVYGSLGNLYQVREGRSHNVRQIDLESMKPVRTLCAHPVEAVPDFDTMLVQKLMLEFDEHDFVRLANLGPIYDHNAVEVIDAQTARYLAEHDAQAEFEIVAEARAEGDTRDAQVIINEVIAELNQIALAA